jgi:glycosyltransferase involved in cell wall biosynthesis
LLLDPPLRQRLGSEARTLAEQRYAPERVAAATVQVYRRLLSERATRHGPAGALTR